MSVIPIIVPTFIRDLFGNADLEKRKGAVKGEAQRVNIMKEILDESKERHARLFAQLTDAEKKKLENAELRMFHSGYYDLLDDESEVMEEMLRKRGVRT